MSSVKTLGASVFLALLLALSACGAPSPSVTPAPTASPAPELIAISPANVSQLTQLAQFGKGTPADVAWSPDNRLLAVATTIGVYVYDASTLQALRFLNTGVDTVRVLFSPVLPAGDDAAYRLLAAGWYPLSEGWNPSGGGGGIGSTLQMWDAGSGTLLYSIENQTSNHPALAFSPDGTIIAAAGGGYMAGTVRLWDAGSGELLQALSDDLIARESAFSIDIGPALRAEGYPRGLVAIGTTRSGGVGDNIELRDVSTGQLVRTLAGHADTVFSLAFSADGRTLMSSDARTVRRWDVLTGASLQVFAGPLDAAGRIQFSPDGQTFVSEGTYEDRHTHIWDASTGQILRTLGGPDLQGYTPLAYNSDGRMLAGLSGNAMWVWDAGSGEMRGTSAAHMGGVTAIAFTPDARRIVSASDDGLLRLWALPGGEMERVFGEVGHEVRGMAISSDGSTVASGGYSGTVQLWNAQTGRLLRNLEGHVKVVTHLAFSPDGHWLASTGADNTVRLWDAKTGRALQVLTAHTGYLASVAFSPDSRTIAAIGRDDCGDAPVSEDAVWVWDVSSGQPLHVLGYHDQVDWGVDLFYSPDGRTLAVSGDCRQSVQLLDANTGAVGQTLQGGGSSVAFSPDGQLLAASSSRGDEIAAWFWDARSGQLLHTIGVPAGHTRGVRAVAFSPDGRLVATGSADGTIRLWGVAAP